MASGKAMANQRSGRGATKAELEAKLREANALLSKVEAKVTEINKRLDQNMTTIQWRQYISIVVTGWIAGMFAGLVIWLFGLFPFEFAQIALDAMR